MKTNDLINANSQPNENELRAKTIYNKLKEFDLNGWLDFQICDFVSSEDLEDINDFTDLCHHLEDNQAFDIDIIYYSKAIKYLQENDASLCDSINIALELGYTLENINSELLASLHASQNARELFNDCEKELSEILTKNN